MDDGVKGLCWCQCFRNPYVSFLLSISFWKSPHLHRLWNIFPQGIHLLIVYLTKFVRYFHSGWNAIESHSLGTPWVPECHDLLIWFLANFRAGRKWGQQKQQTFPTPTLPHCSPRPAWMSAGFFHPSLVSGNTAWHPNTQLHNQPDLPTSCFQSEASDPLCSI